MVIVNGMYLNFCQIIITIVPFQPNLCSSHMKDGGKRDQCIHTCVEKIMREELEYEDPMALENNPCHHLECTRVITKIIHPISTEDGDMSLVSN